MKRIDEEAYKAGGAAFVKGRSIKAIFEEDIKRREEAEKNKNASHDDWRKAEDYFGSFTMGFADALLAKLRNIR